MAEDLITLTLSRKAAQIFMEVYYVYSKVAEKKLKVLKLQLHEVTTSDFPSATKADELADLILDVSNHLDLSRGIADQLRKNDVYPSEIWRQFFKQLISDSEKTRFESKKKDNSGKSIS